MAKDFKISKTAGVCNKCEEALPPGTEIVALVKLGPEELIREDYHLDCWLEPMEKNASENKDVLGVWRMTIPQPEEKKKLLIDDDLLVNFFQRLQGQSDPSKINFRYVLALILMRKKLLNYQGSERNEDGSEIWKMKLRGSENVHEVIDPKMDELMIAEVSASLGEVMQGDFE